MNVLSKNRELKCAYYFGKDDNVVALDECKSIEKSYWSAAVENINSEYKIIVTKNTKYLSGYGDNIVVILKNDEFASDVEYTDKIKAVFRNYFHEKYLSYGNIFFLPLPYLGNIAEFSTTSILKRVTDVFFAGQVTYPERRKLSRIIHNTRNKYKELVVLFKENQEFFSGLNKDQYFSHLGNSKVSLCPEGAAKETCRHFESLHHGCVAVSRYLPDVWYFKDAPIKIINEWENLPELLTNLLNDHSSMEDISLKSIEYWNKNLSPKAVASFIDHSLNSLK